MVGVLLVPLPFLLWEMEYDAGAPLMSLYTPDPWLVYEEEVGNGDAL